MPIYGLDDLKTAFSEEKMQSAEQIYQAGEIVKAEFDESGKSMVGRVNGARNRLFDQQIQILESSSGEGLEIVGTCTCPKGYNCEHVASILLKGLDQPANDGLEQTPMSNWFSRLDDVLKVVEVGEEANRSAHHLVYIFSFEQLDRKKPRILTMRMKFARRMKDGAYDQEGAQAVDIDGATDDQHKDILTARDKAVLKQLLQFDYQKKNGVTKYVLTEDMGAHVMRVILETGRCRWQEVNGQKLNYAGAEKADVIWQQNPAGTQRVKFDITDYKDATIIPLIPPLFIDEETGSCGVIQSGIDPRLASVMLSIPPVLPQHASLVREELQARLNEHNMPLPSEFAEGETRHAEPKPKLTLFCDTFEEFYHDIKWLRSKKGQKVALARLSFDYAGHEIDFSASDNNVIFVENEKLTSIPRDEEVETDCRDRLNEFGFQEVGGLDIYDVPEENKRDLILFPEDPDEDPIAPDEAFLNFGYFNIETLEKEGWTVIMDDTYMFRLAHTDQQVTATIQENVVPNTILDPESDVKPERIDWFSLELNMTLNGEQKNILPILLDYIEDMEQQNRVGDLAKLENNQMIFAPNENGDFIALPVSEVRPLITVLHDLYKASELDEDGKLYLPNVRAGEMAELEERTSDTKLKWKDADRILELGRRLRNFSGVNVAKLPKDFKGTLRGYQQEGVNWLQFLREYDFGGILADDMGLGKTIQTLAHISIEKTSGRMEKPILVVAPTSLMANWRAEAKKFAPNLKVLVLQGPERSKDFQNIQKHDVVLTTYPLLPRDQEIFLNEEFHMLILDEAQTIKNTAAKITQIVQQLNAKYRLCLTGTPMENHLGELWSLMNFLMPGLLGSYTYFRKTFRTPIEKQGDDRRRKALTSRVKPFLLRRTKSEVVKDLPKKTQLLEHIEMEESQLELYEEIRQTMQKKVQDQIATKGLAGSHIIVLDALLKLRQVCCDPRLVKLKTDRPITAPSAKLNYLMETLPDMIASGRRILLFSQFTSMLDLIEEALGETDIDYVTLTGQTKDRETPVNAFQNEEVPLFLISLKAGGTGLNLTAADTVIHYDPWWNPAVESQATDRAHRIGQTKPVFIHKLITAGTVEEKIIELQERKKALVEGLYDQGGQAGLSALSEDDLTNLFAPVDKD